MIIRQEDKVLIQAGTFRVAENDKYSMIIETTGLALNGDRITYQVVMSHSEVSTLMHAWWRLPEAKALRPRR